MKNIYWVGNNQTNNITLLYKPGEEPTWLSWAFQKNEKMPEPMWAGWYPDEGYFIAEIRKDELPEDWYLLKNPGKFAIGFINAIFNDDKLREKLYKDFKGER